jgi:hypothetical protein
MIKAVSKPVAINNIKRSLIAMQKSPGLVIRLGAQPQTPRF